MSTHSRSYIQEQLGQSSGKLTKDFAVVETILRDRHQFFEEIREGIGVQEKNALYGGFNRCLPGCIWSGVRLYP
jgi:hypothetical protein